MKNYRRAFPIGYDVVKLDASNGHCTLTLISPSCAEEGTFTPAQDVTIYGMNNITELRDRLTELIDEHQKKREELEDK